MSITQLVLYADGVKLYIELVEAISEDGLSRYAANMEAHIAGLEFGGEAMISIEDLRYELVSQGRAFNSGAISLETLRTVMVHPLLAIFGAITKKRPPADDQDGMAEVQTRSGEETTRVLVPGDEDSAMRGAR